MSINHVNSIKGTSSSIRWQTVSKSKDFGKEYDSEIQKVTKRDEYIASVQKDSNMCATYNYQKGSSVLGMRETFLEDLEKENVQKTESKSDANIIVKPDGTKILVVTMNVGGMETTMSIKISDPTGLASETNNEELMSNTESTKEPFLLYNEITT